MTVELTIREVEALEGAMEEATAAMGHYPGMLAEMSLIYLVANFEAFLSELLFSLLTARPEMLKAARQVTVADVVEAESREDLICAIARREVGTWTYLSFHDQATRLTEDLGVDFGGLEAQLEIAAEAHARRNLLAHKGGIIDDRYLKAVPESDQTAGTRLEFDAEYLKAVNDSLCALVDGLAEDISTRCLEYEAADVESPADPVEVTSDASRDVDQGTPRSGGLGSDRQL